jgi:hypothetical protein
LPIILQGVALDWCSHYYFSQEQQNKIMEEFKKNKNKTEQQKAAYECDCPNKTRFTLLSMDYINSVCQKTIDNVDLLECEQVYGWHIKRNQKAFMSLCDDNDECKTLLSCFIIISLYYIS